jgi:flavin reductase (DIM6/NTAB) family NADH-FMN oxidoreductase RutF
VDPFEDLVSDLTYPMFVVTARDGGERAGCLVGFTTQCSIDPPRFLVCISKANRTHDVAAGARVLAVHLLAEGERDLAERFGAETGDVADKFEGLNVEAGPEEVPVLADVERWFAGAVLERLDLGDHTGMVLEPIAGDAESAAEPLDFQQVADIDPGHEP